MDEKILKADPIPEKIMGSSPKVLKREVFEAGREARDVVTLAEEKARQILAEAERQRSAIYEQARQEGNAKGLAEWNQILVQASRRADELTKNWEDTMLRLSVQIAGKIIGEELKLNPEAIVSIVMEVLKGTRAGKRLTIQVNEADVQLVRSRVNRVKESLSASTEIEIIASASVPVGGCVIESELGIIDARLETQLKCLEDALVRGASTD
jgi:type III secretion protein L